MKNFIERLSTGIIYVVLVVAGVMTNSYTYLALFSLILVLCLNEFYTIINNVKDLSINKVFNCFAGLILFWSAYLYAAGIFDYYIFFPYLLYIVMVLIAELYQKRGDPLGHLAFTFFGQCYVTLPISMINLIAFRSYPSGAVEYYSLILLALFVFLWINDSTAYLIGRTFGKHRLLERISPLKSWEGFFGGLISTMASSFVFAYYGPQISSVVWMGMAFVVVIFGTWGDLVESQIKRTLEIKDSGNALPGHGGFLDRFDSLLLAVYGVLFYIQIFIRN